MDNKINDIVLEKLIKWNNMTLRELCDELWYRPQQHNFVFIDDEIKIFDNYEWYKNATLKDLLECKYFIFHINLYFWFN